MIFEYIIWGVRLNFILLKKEQRSKAILTLKLFCCWRCLFPLSSRVLKKSFFWNVAKNKQKWWLFPRLQLYTGESKKRTPVPCNTILLSTISYCESILFLDKYEDKMKTEINLARSK